MKKFEGEKREKRICFRVSESEYLKILQNAGLVGVTATKYCQLLALETKIKSPKISPETGRQIVSNLAKIGSNINQIARVLNQKQEPNASMVEEIQEIRNKLNDIWSEME